MDDQQEGSVLSNDPWKHRSQNMRCKTCMWFVAKGNKPEFGRCRRHAPVTQRYSGLIGVVTISWTKIKFNE